MSVKEKLLAYLSKPDYMWNTLSVAQARARFNAWNISARVYELREEGWPIYTNTRYRADGSKVNVYRMGTPSRSMKLYAKQNGIRLHQVA